MLCMWDNIGVKLQKYAKFVCWLGIIVTAISSIVIWSVGGSNSFLTGLLILVVGGLASWIGSWSMYGLGVVVEYVEKKKT